MRRLVLALFFFSLAVSGWADTGGWSGQSLEQHNDVDQSTTPTDGQILQWDATFRQWKFATQSGGSVSDAVYGAGWNGDATVAPSKNAVYDKIESLAGGHDAVTLGVDADVLLGLTTQQLTLDSQAANLIFAGPGSGAAADPTFRSLVDNDVPDTITASSYQPVDADLTAIAALGFTATAFLKKTAADTWALDTATYLTTVGTGTINELTYWSGANTLGTLAVATYPSLAELAYVKGATSAIQTQLNAKAAALSGNLNEIAYFNTTSTIASLVVATYPSLTELAYVKGVTSAIQTQINAKSPSTAPTFATSITGSYLTASEILGTDASKNIVSLPVITYPSLTELSYVKGLSSAIQTQLGLKSPLASPTFTGTVTVPTPFTIGAVSMTTTGTILNYLASAGGTTGTTSTNIVFSTSPSLTTPTLGVASATSLATSAATPLLLTNGQLVNIALTSQTVGATTLTIPNFASVADTFVFKTLADTLSNKTFVSPALGTPASGVMTNVTGVPAAAILAGSFGAGAYVISTSLQAATIELGHATDTTIARVAAGVASVEGETMNGYTTTATAAGTTTLSITATKTQFFTGTTTQIVKLPTTSVIVGQAYIITNLSTGLVSVQSSGANAIVTLGLNQSATFTALAATPTTAANWSFVKTNVSANTNGKRILVVTQAATPAMDTDNGDIVQITGIAQAITSMTTSLTGTPVAGDLLEIQFTDSGTGRALTFGASFASTTVTLPTTTVANVMLRVLFQYVGTTWACIAVS